MTHEGEYGHQIGCDCVDCVVGRQQDQLAERLQQLIYERDTGTLTVERREVVDREILGLNAKLDLV